MIDQELTLNQYFATELPRAGVFSEKQLEKAETQIKMAELKKKFEKELKLAWPVARQVMVEQTLKLLNIKVLNIVGEAWKKYEELVKYNDREKYKPDDINFVSLLERTVESVHKPFIDILVDGRSIGKINFEIKVALKFDSVRLKIQGGKIKEMELGACQGSGSISCEGKELINKKTQPVPLTGAFPLDIEIPVIPGMRL